MEYLYVTRVARHLNETSEYHLKYIFSFSLLEFFSVDKIAVHH